jgi:hypothetical protein
MSVRLPETLQLSVYDYPSRDVTVGSTEMIEINANMDVDLGITDGTVVGQELTVTAKLTGNSGQRFANPSLKIKTLGRFNRKAITPENLPGFLSFKGKAVSEIVVNPTLAYLAGSTPGATLGDPWVATIFLKWGGSSWVVIGGNALPQ